MICEYWLKASHPSACDVGAQLRYPDSTRKRNSSPWGHLIAGAIAGAASRTATAPLETLRLLAMTGALGSAQVGAAPAAGAGAAVAGAAGIAAVSGPLAVGALAGVPQSRSMAAAAAAAGGRRRGGLSVGSMFTAGTNIVRTQGWRALYRGNGANVARSAPQKALDFFAFDAFKDMIGARSALSPKSRLATAATSPTANPKNSSSRSSTSSQASAESPGAQLGTLGTLAAAGLAGAVSSSLLYPLEVVRTRLSTDTAGVYRNVAHAFRTIVKTEGGFALYR